MKRSGKTVLDLYREIKKYKLTAQLKPTRDYDYEPPLLSDEDMGITEEALESEYLKLEFSDCAVYRSRFEK